MAVAFDAKTATVTSVNGAATMTVSNLTVGSGSNRAMALIMSWASGTMPTGITATWDNGGTNQAMALVAGTNASSGASSDSVAIYGLIAPTSGNKNLVINWTGNLEAHATAISFTGVDQTSVAVAFPHGATNLKAVSTSNPTSVTITSATGNMVIAGHIEHVAAYGAISGTTLAKDDTTGPAQAVVYNYANGAATVTMTAAFSGSDVWSAFGCDVLAAAGVAATIVEQAFFDVVKMKRPSELSQGPFAGTSPPLSTTFATSPLFERVNLKRPTVDTAPALFQPAATAALTVSQQPFFDPVKPRPPIISVPDVMSARSPPRPVGDKWFESIRLKQPVIDNAPTLFTPITATVTATIVEQTFFEKIVLRRSADFPPGPFAGTSPPLTIPYVTREFFDQIRLRQPILDAPSPLFPATQVVVAVNFSLSNRFDTVKLFKVPDRFGEFFPQKYPTPQPSYAWFDQTKLLRIPERLQEQFGRPFPPTVVGTAWFLDTVRLKPAQAGFDFTKATIQQVTIQNALTDWFASVRLKQPIIDQPLVVYYPAQAPPPPDTGRPHNLPFMVTVGRFRSF